MELEQEMAAIGDSSGGIGGTAGTGSLPPV